MAARNLCMLSAAGDSASRGTLGTLKGYQGHSENHQLNCVHLVLPVRRFA